MGSFHRRQGIYCQETGLHIFKILFKCMNMTSQSEVLEYLRIRKCWICGKYLAKRFGKSTSIKLSALVNYKMIKKSEFVDKDGLIKKMYCNKIGKIKTMEKQTVKEALDVLIGMIQRATTLRASNVSIYGDKVTEYRERLFQQAMKVRKKL